MQIKRRQKLLAKADNRILAVAFIFMCCAFFTALARADVRRVEGLEFSKVHLLGDNQLEFTQSEATLLKVLGDKSDLQNLPFVVKGDTLYLGLTAQGDKASQMKFKLTAPRLESLVLNGSGEAFVKPLAVENLLVALEGSGAIRMFDVQALELEMRVVGSGALQAVDVKAGDARLSMQGSGDIQLGSLQSEAVKAHLAGSGDISIEEGGQADRIKVAVMGSGDVNLGQMSAREAVVTIMGSGDVELRAEESLDVEIMGSGDLAYFGTPEISTSVMGSGEVLQRD
jgi:hypothetical protein